MRFFFIILSIVCSIKLHAQYAPQVGLAGHTAIHKDSSIIVAWADSCVVKRGLQNIADAASGYANAGSYFNALSKADGSTCSLGDKGEIIYYFANPITNKTGADFAIFENGFLNTTNDSLAFLELATVAVSSNGIDFAMFPAVCNTNNIGQIGGFGASTNASSLHNLAGKYIGNYGTPFDLSEIVTNPKINLASIQYIKIVDVCGSIDTLVGTLDVNNNAINDPYPTPFLSSGFDIDALGVIHQLYPSSLINNVTTKCKVYPNPVKDFVVIESNTNAISLYSITGVLIPINLQQLSTNKFQIQLQYLPAGIYYLKVGHNSARHLLQKI